MRNHIGAALVGATLYALVSAPFPEVAQYIIVAILIGATALYLAWPRFKGLIAKRHWKDSLGRLWGKTWVQMPVTLLIVVPLGIVAFTFVIGWWLLFLAWVMKGVKLLAEYLGFDTTTEIAGLVVGMYI